MSRGITLLLVAVGLLLVLLSLSAFTVREDQLAIKFQMGQLVRSDYEPGLYFKVPFIQQVRKFDRRVLQLDAEPERYLTREKKNVIVDAFVKWRISDVETYYRATAGDERQAGVRLFQIIKDGLRAEFGRRTIQEAISGERSEIINITQLEEQARQFGMSVLDVRVKRIELPPEVSSSVYARMEAERARVAKDLRSRGAEAAEKIKAEADRQSTVTIAVAERDSERVRGEGDARASEIYAQAFSRDPEFFDFYRSINAYQNAFGGHQDMLVLDPSSEFFRYLKNADAGGAPRGAGQRPPPAPGGAPMMPER